MNMKLRSAWQCDFVPAKALRQMVDLDGVGGFLGSHQGGKQGKKVVIGIDDGN